MVLSRRRSLPALIAAVAGLGLAFTAVLGSRLPAAEGQTAGPVATPQRAVVAGPANGGVAVLPSSSNAAAAGGLNAAASGSPAGTGGVLGAPNQPLSPAAGSASGQGNVAGGAPATNLNLTPDGELNLIAGQSLVYVPAQSASCSATAFLSYSSDAAFFTATCAGGGAASLSKPALLCMQPSPELFAKARGNLANLAVTAGGPLASHISPSGILVCSAITAPGSYTLSVTGDALPPAPLHVIPKGVQVHLPAVGLGGMAGQ